MSATRWLMVGLFTDKRHCEEESDPQSFLEKKDSVKLRLVYNNKKKIVFLNLTQRWSNTSEKVFNNWSVSKQKKEEENYTETLVKKEGFYETYTVLEIPKESRVILNLI